MTRLTLGLSLWFASFAVASAAGHLAMALADRATRTAWWTRLGARTRASFLVQARLAPVLLSVLFAALVQAAFWSFEPVGSGESVGGPLLVLALAGVVLSSLVAARAWRSASATRRLAKAWRACGVEGAVEGWDGRAWIVETPFPVVAVIGLRRAELFVSRDVIASCSQRELATIAAHERAHVAGRDNLTRLLLAITPTVGAAAARLDRTWEATAEELADGTARAGGNGVTLARVLMKVARLVDRHTGAPELAVSAFIGNGSLDARVRRLLDPPRAAGPTLHGPSLALTAGLLAGAAWGLPAIYEVAEQLVQLGR